MKMPSEYAFPFQGEEIEVLRAAMKANRVTRGAVLPG